MIGNFLVMSYRACTVERSKAVSPILLGSNILQHIAEYKPQYDRLKQATSLQKEVCESDVHIGSVRIRPVEEETLLPGVKIEGLCLVKEAAVASLLHKHKDVFFERDI